MAENKEIHEFVFDGTLQKIQLISNCVCYGPCPKPEEEIEQRLTIRFDGRVWLSRYNYGDFDAGYECIENGIINEQSSFIL